MYPEEMNVAKSDKILLRALSSNSRTSLAELSRQVGMSPATTNKLLKHMVSHLGVKFTLEVDLDKLGFSERHILSVRFGKKPDELFLSELFAGDPFTQDAFITNGGFDLLLFVAADTPMNYMKWETDIAVKLSKYLPEFRPSEYIFDMLGFMPLNDSFVDFIKEGIKADATDRALLRILNGNSRASYREMGNELGVNEDTVRYRVFKLQRSGIIRRFTVAVQNSGGVLSSYFMRYRFDERTMSDIFPKQRRHNVGEDDALPLVNRTPMLVLLSGSYRFFGLSFGYTRKQSIDSGVKWHANLLKGNNPHEAHAVITKSVKGLLPLRNLDAERNYRYIWR